MRALSFAVIFSLAACDTSAPRECTTALDCAAGERCVDERCVASTDAGPPDAGPCTPDCTGRVCGPDPVCGTSCGACPEPGYCNEQIGACVELDALCPQLGAPMSAFDEEALGIATNELTWPNGIGIDRGIAFDDVQRIGVHYVQLGTLWETVEPAEGAFDWTSTDTLLAEASSRGLTPILILGAPAPEWARDSTGALRLDAWRAYVRAVVLRYGSMGMRVTNEFQFDNEPNHSVHLPRFLYTTREAYLELLIAMAEEAHATDPAARVWGPALGIHAWQDGAEYDGWSATLDHVPLVDASEPMQWLDAVLATNAVDVVAVHLYYKNLQRMVDVFRRIVAHVSEYRDGHVPIVVNEFNTDAYCQVDDDEDAHAEFVSSFFTCLIAAGADSALYFNSTDFLIGPAVPLTCEGDTYYPLGLRSHDDRARSVLYALDHLNDRIAAQRTAAARIEAVPAECELGAAASCTTSLVFARRTETREVVVRRESTGETVACLPATEISGTADVMVTAARERFTLHAASGCAAPELAVLDDVYARGTTTARAPRQGAIFQMDGPCSIADGAPGCIATLAWWSERVDTATYPKVLVFVGDLAFACSDANTVSTFSSRDPFLTRHRFRLYEASSCDASTATLGRLLAATRAQGR